MSNTDGIQQCYSLQRTCRTCLRNDATDEMVSIFDQDQLSDDLNCFLSELNLINIEV